jgi:hypothetical protein
LPRFFGITKTLSPVFSAPDEDEDEDEDEDPEDGLDDPEELHAASTAEALRSTTGPSSVRLTVGLISESFQSRAGCQRLRCAVPGLGEERDVRPG